MTKISDNFSYEEFSVSASFPKLATGIPAQFKPAIRDLVLNVLQPICDNTGWNCWINSGYRSAALNKAVGGVESSQHRVGEAADCVFHEGTRLIPIIDVLRKAQELKLNYDQMIAYPTFVHFSHTTKRRNRNMSLYNSSYKGKKLYQ